MTYNAALSACDRRSQWRSLIMLHLVGFPLAVQITNFSSMRHSPCSLLSFVKFPPDHLASCWLACVFQCHDSNLLNRLQLLRLDTLISQRLQPDLLSYLYFGSPIVPDFRSHKLSAINGAWRMKAVLRVTKSFQIWGFNAAFSACKGQPSAKLLLDEMGSEELSRWHDLM